MCHNVRRQERGEVVGGTVGYSVRLDTRASAATRLLYCTTGAPLSACQASDPTSLPRPARAVVPADLPPAAPALWPMARPRPAGAPAACGERRGARAGVLLRRLQGDAGLAGLSHVVVDEVHERSADTDLLLLLLRDALAAQPGGRLRVVLMSATADVAAFARYFAAGLPARPRRDAAQPPLARQCCQGSGRLGLPGKTLLRWQA